MNHFSAPSVSQKPAPLPMLPPLPSELLSLPRRRPGPPEKAEFGLRDIGSGVEVVWPGELWWRVPGGEKAAVAAADNGDVGGFVAVEIARGAEGDAVVVAVGWALCDARLEAVFELGTAGAEAPPEAADLKALWAWKAEKRLARKGRCEGIVYDSESDD